MKLTKAQMNEFLKKEIAKDVKFNFIITLLLIMFIFNAFGFLFVLIWH